MYTKKEFLDAYIYCYGTTKADAERAYQNSPPAWREAVIESLKNDIKNAFYYD